MIWEQADTHDVNDKRQIRPQQGSKQRPKVVWISIWLASSKRSRWSRHDEAYYREDAPVVSVMPSMIWNCASATICWKLSLPDLVRADSPS
jgi:hypothetical protein